jgi:nicotinic acid mononucleotide adenylyltransferase
MVLRVALACKATGVAVATGGLFIDMAREARRHFPGAGISILCGRDAAERALAWDYGGGASIESQLAEYSLLVAARAGEFEMPATLRHLKRRVERVELGSDWSAVSSTEVRRRIAAGEDWSGLVPSAVAGLVKEFYS